MSEKTGYEIAVERIEEVARTGGTHLDLRGLGLTKVPDNLIYMNEDPVGVVADRDQPVHLVSSRPLRVLLFHAEEDRLTAQELHNQLTKESWMDIKREEVSLFPSQQWDTEREKVINETDVFIVCLSTSSFDKAERLPRELSLILKIIYEKPEGILFIIPLRLDDCQVPNRFRGMQYADYFPENNKKWTYQRLLESLRLRAQDISILAPSTTTTLRSFRIFICHSHEDKTIARELYNQLITESWLNVWLSDQKLLPGQDWDMEIRKAIRQAHIVIVCLSNNSISKEGYFQKELRMALDESDKVPEGKWFIIPLRLDECEVPRPFRHMQVLDYSLKEKQNSTYHNLVKLIHDRAMEVVPERFSKRKLKLESIDLSMNQLASLPIEIGHFVDLVRLNLTENRLTHLSPEIARLTNLTQLYISHNQLVSAPTGIGQLTKLTLLDLSNNKFTALPLTLKNLKGLKELNIRENPLPVPPEILEKVGEPQAILNFLAELWVGQRRPLTETKMLVVGQGSVGKTSLINRLTNNLFSSSEIKTDGIAITPWQVANSEMGESQPKFVRVNIWDFGGQEIMHATHQFFLTRRSLYLLVLDSRISQEENRVEYWLKIIQSFGGESPVLVVGNKSDQHPLDIDRTGLQKKYPNIVGILETSAATGDGLRQLNLAITEQVNKLPHVRDSLPEVWFNVKNQLEELGQVQNYISQEKYTDTCVNSEVHDEISQRTLIGFLHDLGVVLHFQDDPRLESLGILNPQWVTNGVYKILNSRNILDNNGVMTLTMLNEILDLPEYPSDKRLFIVEMMRKFELCYEIDRDNFLIPDLLPKNDPFVGEKEWGSALAFQYHYNVLPSSIITRFIVRMNALIHKTVWRSGVVLKKEDNLALVKADAEERKIYFWVSGAENTRRDFLSVIRAEFDAIHKTIIKIEAIQKVPHPEYPELVMDYAELLQFERDGITEFPRSVDGKTVIVNVRQLLNGVRVGEVAIDGKESPTKQNVEVSKLNNPPNKSAKSIVAKQSIFEKRLMTVFISLPRIIGRFALDIFGRGKDSADSTCIVLGYVLLVLGGLVLWGIIDVNSLRDWFAGWWRFFFPVK